MSGRDEGPIARWSRRKAAAAAEPQDAPTPEEVKPAALDAALPIEPVLGETERGETVPDGADAAETERPPLTPIEDLNADSDYTQFLADGVPEALTRAALRKLWLSDPVLANLDGLNDYDENFNLIDKIITAADTNYKVGRGMPGGADGEEPMVEEALEDETIETPMLTEVVEGESPSVEDGAAEDDFDTGDDDGILEG